MVARRSAAQVGLTVFSVSMVVFVLAPLVVIVAGSFTQASYLDFPPTRLGTRWYVQLSAEPRWALAAWNTARIGVPVAILSVVLATCAALSVVRTRSRFIATLGTLFVAPMMLPHIIVAIGLYPTILKLGLSGTYLAVVIGHTVVATPVAFLTVSASLRSYPATLEVAAATMGADPFRVFVRVTYPMIRVGMAIGGLFAFVTSFDELVLSLFLTGPRTETLPRLIWEHLFFTLTPEVAAVATLVLAVSLGLLGAALVLGRHRAELVGMHEANPA